GRNGGWVSHLLPGNRSIYAQQPEGAAGVRRLQRAMFDAVQEIINVMQAHDIDVDAVQNGSITFARNPAALARIRRTRHEDLQWGLEPEDAIELSGTEVRERIDIDGVVGGVLHPVVARIHPKKLVNGIAQIIEERGVKVFEESRVLALTETG